MPRPHELLGQPFGSLTVLSLDHVSEGGTRYWRCSCTCGRDRIVTGTLLVQGRATSCGCQRVRYTKHQDSVGGQRSPELRSFYAMRGRCLNANHSGYVLYGGRGVRIHPAWLDKRTGFAAFLVDVGRMPGPGYTLDRFPNKDGNYEPGNVRWATAKEQANNRNDNHVVNYRGESLTLSQLLERLWPDYATRNAAATRVQSRLKKGWSVEDAFDTPPNPHGVKGVKPLSQREVHHVL